MKRLAVLIALLVLAAPASAQEGVDDATGQLNETVEDGRNATNGILDGLSGIAEGIGDAAEATGDGIAKGAGAVGKGLAGLVRFAGTAVLATVTIVAQTGAATSQAFADAISGLGAGAGFVGAALTGTVLLAGDGLVFVAALAWSGISSVVLAYAGLVGALRPETMPVAVFGSVTAVGAAGSAGAGGWAGFQALRKWGLAGAGFAGVAGFSRINDADLLEHPLRGEIFSTIQQHPGIHASQLARELDVGWGTITHHLDKLQRAKLVATRKVNNQKCFFEQGGEISRADMAIASALKGDTASSIASFVNGHPMTSQKQMAEALEISPALASFHVKKLVTLGVLEKFRHGKETLLSCSDGMRRVMASADPATAATLQDAGFEYSS